MPRNPIWTDARDAQVRRRRIEGANWETIAAELSLTVPAVTQRACHIGVSHLPAATDDPGRDPLPAGHPASWQAINAGTVLEGEPYPLRVFRR